MATKPSTPKSPRRRAASKSRPPSTMDRASGPSVACAVGGPSTARAVGGSVTARAAVGPITMRRAVAGPDTLTVVYVHGIGNKPAPATLKRQFDQALFGIDMGARTRIAYWADIRYPQPLPSKESDTPMIGALGTRRLGVKGADRLVEDLPEGEAAARYAERIARRLLAKSGRRGAQAKGVEAKVLPDLIRRRVTEWLTKTFIEDTAAYFFDAGQRFEIQQRLRQILLAGAGPYIVVAHSQGTIIAYDVLRDLENGASFEVPLLVTIGAPLGLEEVQDHLAKPLAVPRMVKEWWNFADRLDPVALDQTREDEFTPRGAIQDERVVNKDTLRISNFNPHSGTGYMSTEKVHRTVSERVPDGFVSPIAPFVIARDVATDMADPTARLPVLIELKSVENGGAGSTLESIGATLEGELQAMERAFVERFPVSTRPESPFRIDRLRRYVAARLTAEEIDRVAAHHEELQIHTLWKNSAKRALLDRSIETVQVTTAHRGYGALGQGIGWAVLDTGIAADHPHFGTHKNVAALWDCTQPGKPVASKKKDKDGHGTHVAGIIAGAGKGIKDQAYAGMAPKAKLHVYRVLDDEGNGEDAWIVKAIDHILAVNEAASDLVIHGVNLSLGGPFDEAVFACGFSPICRELRRLWRQGVVVCIAAGNEGNLVIDTQDGEQSLNLDLSIGDPANLDEAIAVGSVHRDSPHMYGISYFSSRGPTADGRAKPDVVAPGEKIMSCQAGFKKGVPKTYYVAESGTSMACPHISGIVAAFLSVRREFIGSPERVKEILMRHCTDLARDRYHQGAGLPNLVKMLMAT